MDYYLLLIWNDVQPALHGPFESAEERDKEAKRLREEFGTTSSFFPMEATKGSKVSVGSYTADFFE